VYHSTDVYAMGVVLYELLTGRLPFDAETEFALQESIIRQAPTPIRRINPKLSESLEQAVLRALEKDPARRYSSAAEFALQLDRFLADTGGTDSPAHDERRYQKVYDTMRRKLAAKLFGKTAE
jgi:serine/threonine-protein kinase